MRRFFENEAGFTLLELLVVVAVIGILAAIIVPQVGDVTEDADRAAAESSLANLQSAIEQYRLGDGEGDYPSDLGDIGVSDENIEYAQNPNGLDEPGYEATYEVGDDILYIDSDTTGVQISE